MKRNPAGAPLVPLDELREPLAGFIQPASRLQRFYLDGHAGVGFSGTHG
jgi:hypothetical protein